FDVQVGLFLQGKLDITTDCPFEFQEGFDLQEGYSVGFDTVKGFFANPATDPMDQPILPVANAFASVQKLGKGDVKFSVGPDLKLTIHIGSPPVEIIGIKVPSLTLLDASADLGVLAFIDVGVSNTSPTFHLDRCMADNIDCVQGEVTFKAGM